MDFEEVLIQRISIRSYKNNKVEEEKIQELIQNIITAPSAGNKQAYKIYVIENEEILEKLKDAAWDQKYVAESGLVFLFCANPTEHSGKAYGDKEARFFALQDATIAAAYCQLSATNMGLSSVWIGAFEDEEVKNLLDIEKTEIPVAIIPIGYANEIGYPTTRKPIEEVVKRIK